MWRRTKDRGDEAIAALYRRGWHPAAGQGGPGEDDEQTIAAYDRVVARPTPEGPNSAFIVSAYEAHHAEVYAFLARATRDRSLAAELLRETYRSLAKESRSGQAQAPVRDQLYRLASTVVLERNRARKPSRRPGRVALAPRDPGPSLGAEEDTDIDQAIAGLSIEARVALLLSAEGFRGDEIAAAIVQSPSATRTLLCLARARVHVRRGLFAAEGQ